MRFAAVLLLSAVAALGANDPWGKVRDLKTGTELRIFKKGSTRPVSATLDEANDENLIVVIKNEEVAISREDIDRIDYRPKQAPAPIVKETRTTERGPEGTAPLPMGQVAGPSTSTTTSYGRASKPDFETIYRRPPPAKKD